jgi:ABC-type branched-subunit amino acid transport system substrate-binding protein
MAQIGWKPLRLGLEASEDPQVLQSAGQSTEEIIYAKYTAGTKDFQNRFKARFGREAQLPAALAYDAVKVLAHAMNQSHELSAEAVGQRLNAIRGFRGSSGDIQFVDGTRSERPVELWTIRGGRPQLLAD